MNAEMARIDKRSAPEDADIGSPSRKRGPYHRKKVPESGVWPCKINGCNKQFAREADLKRHQRTTKTHSVPSFECPQCEASFTRTDALRRHQKSRHNGVVIELPNTDRRDDHLSEGSQSHSRSPTPSKNISAATPESASAGGASAPAASIAGPSTYYRPHTSDSGYIAVPGPQGMILPTSATRSHDGPPPPPGAHPWPHHIPPPPWTDPSQMGVGYMMPGRYYPHGAPPPHPIYGTQMIYSDPRHPHPHSGAVPAGGAQRGDGTPAIDPSLDASASGAVAMAAAGAVPVLVPLHPALAVETVQAAMEAVLQCAKRDPTIMAQLDKQEKEEQERQVTVGASLSENRAEEVDAALAQQDINMTETPEQPKNQAASIVPQPNSVAIGTLATDSGPEDINETSLPNPSTAMDIDAPSQKEHPEGSGGGDEDAEGEYESVEQEGRLEPQQPTPDISSALDQKDKQSMTSDELFSRVSDFMQSIPQERLNTQ